MKRRGFFFLLLLLLLTTPPIHAWETKDLVGNYELQGVMEMAGGLSLGADGKYAAGFSYGAADWVEIGTWKPDGDGLALSGSRFKAKNADLPLFLPNGTRFVYQDGRLTATGPGGKVVFVDPNKTPSQRKKTSQPGEGRMLVRGKVVRLDADVMVVKMGECLVFAVSQLSPDVLKVAKKGKSIDVEIPYSAMFGSESCP